MGAVPSQHHILFVTRLLSAPHLTHSTTQSVSQWVSVRQSVLVPQHTSLPILPALLVYQGADLSHTQNRLLCLLWLMTHVCRALSPTRGLSQMYRSPDTTALVGRLKESVKDLRGERDSLSAQLNALKLDVRWVLGGNVCAEAMLWAWAYLRAPQRNRC